MQKNAAAHDLKDSWEKVLQSHKLSMDRGKSPQFVLKRGTVDEQKISRMTCVGTMTNLAGVEQEEFLKDLGIRKPEGHGPD